jgi:hypothetical protein
MHISSFIRLILFLGAIYIIIAYLDGREPFSNTKITCNSDFTYYNNFSVTDTSNNTYFLIDYKDIKLEDKNNLSVHDLVLNNPTKYSFNTEMTGFEINNTGTIIHPLLLTNINNSYTISTFLKSDACTLNISIPEYKIGLFNDEIIKNLLCYTDRNSINIIDATFEPINIYNTFSIIPVSNNYYTLSIDDKNPITINLENNKNL